MSRNKLLIAAAGAGKTTHIVKKALSIEEGNSLITTYTQVNEEEIRKKFIELNGFIPGDITIQTWFSFLIQHGVKPFQSFLFEEKVKGLTFVNKQSGIKYYYKGNPIPFKESKNFKRHYFSKGNKIYSDKLSKFVYKCNLESNGLVIDRISKIYQNIFIDEAQDLAGYDLSFLKQIFSSDSSLTLVGDPRQVTYLTHWEKKYKKYQSGKIADFINDECADKNVEIDRTTLSNSHRNNPEICNFANRLYPDFEPAKSANNEETEHDGIFLVKSKDRFKYLDKYDPIQLRWSSKNKKVLEKYPVLNFGESKGQTYDRVLIYPTKSMLNWIKDPETNLKDQTKAKFYVAITRARFSVGIVCGNNLKELNKNKLVSTFTCE
ncbi:UvrD-helicase domain-containing protein [Fodinibius salsisoli]|uniref:UvrD-helicase domain-containing protein n=1 Tax=Fodinibius salsisoli TaxID=2820877 RepID=A0ABT3PT41_9BACT|nr:UvrD-helicase domain-containing protein [Fodinibius salsisoli]MCW9709028.1 UvrD-helicase domain-containing protein [Fodinibius salsisoli]